MSSFFFQAPAPLRKQNASSLSKISVVRNSILFFGLISIIFFSCSKTGNNNSPVNLYDGVWKLQVLEIGCGPSLPRNLVVSLGRYSTNTFPISCTPILAYTFYISGSINSNGVFSGNLFSPDYASVPCPFTGNCSSPDSCSASGSAPGSAIAVTITR